MKKTYLISYDLHKPERNYPKVEGGIKKLKPHRHPLESTWLVKSDWTTKELKEYMTHYVDDHDSFLVVEVAGDVEGVRLKPL
jgi:hypothetical protein